MADGHYEPPEIQVMGDMSDLTLGRGGSKPGIYFDMPYSGQGNKSAPPPGYPGTVS